MDDEGSGGTHEENDVNEEHEDNEGNEATVERTHEGMRDEYWGWCWGDVGDGGYGEDGGDGGDEIEVVIEAVRGV